MDQSHQCESGIISDNDFNTVKPGHNKINHYALQNGQHVTKYQIISVLLFIEIKRKKDK